MDICIILLSDHTWYYVDDYKQAKAFVQNHKWDERVPSEFRYGIYIMSDTTKRIDFEI